MFSAAAQGDAPATPAPRRSRARLGTWAEIDSSYNLPLNSETASTPSVGWLQQSANPTTFAGKQAASRRQQFAQTDSQPTLELSKILRPAAGAKNVRKDASRKDNTRDVRQQQLEAASASVDPSPARPPRELMPGRFGQNQQQRQAKQKKQQLRDGRTKSARAGSPMSVSAKKAPVATAAEDADKLNMLTEAQMQANGTVKHLELETNFNALFGASALPTPTTQSSAFTPSDPVQAAAKPAPAPPASTLVPTPRITQLNRLPFMGKRRLMEQFGGRYSRFLPDKAVAASLPTGKRDPLAYARLTLARNRDVGLGRRKVALQLMDSAAASPTGGADARA